MEKKKSYHEFITMKEFCKRSGRTKGGAYEFRYSKVGRQFFHRFPGENKLYMDWTSYEAELLKQKV